MPKRLFDSAKQFNSDENESYLGGGGGGGGVGGMIINY